MRAKFKPNVNPPEAECVEGKPVALGFPVVELADADEASVARDLIVTCVNPDIEAEPSLYLSSVVIDAERIHFPVQLVGHEALALMVASARAAAYERDLEAGRLAIAA